MLPAAVPRMLRALPARGCGTDPFRPRYCLPRHAAAARAKARYAIAARRALSTARVAAMLPARGDQRFCRCLLVLPRRHAAAAGHAAQRAASPQATLRRHAESRRPPR